MPALALTSALCKFKISYVLLLVNSPLYIGLYMLTLDESDVILLQWLPCWVYSLKVDILCCSYQSVVCEILHQSKYTFGELP